MMHTSHFTYKPAVKNLDAADERATPATLENALVGFIHVEPEDEEKLGYVETKLVKNLKWAARKNETSLIVLHSFAHLAEAKAQPETTRRLLDNAAARLQKAGYETHQTPFGYFLDLDMHVPGHSFGRLFKKF